RWMARMTTLPGGLGGTVKVAEMVPVRSGVTVAITGPSLALHRITTEVGATPAVRGTGKDVPTMVIVSPGRPDSALGEMVARLVQANAVAATASAITAAAAPTTRGPRRSGRIRPSVTPAGCGGNGVPAPPPTLGVMRSVVRAHPRLAAFTLGYLAVFLVIGLIVGSDVAVPYVVLIALLI